MPPMRLQFDSEIGIAAGRKDRGPRIRSLNMEQHATSIGFVGGGNMGEALIGAILAFQSI